MGISCLGGLDERAVLLVRRAKHLDYQTHLMNSLPGKRGFLPRISAKMHPIDQISIALLCNPRSSEEALAPDTTV